MQVLISRSKWREFRGSVAIAGLQRGEVRMKAVDFNTNSNRASIAKSG